MKVASCKGAFVTLTSKNPAGKPTFIPSSRAHVPMQKGYSVDLKKG